MFSASRGRARLGCAPSTRFSCTVRSANTPRSSGTSAIPASTISCGGRWVMSFPSISTVPPSAARIWPAIARRKVLLPAPLAPSITTISPADTLTDTFSTAR